MAFGVHRLPPARYPAGHSHIWDAQSGLLDCYLLLRLATARRVKRRPESRLRDLLEDRHSSYDRAERGVARGKRRVLVDEEELAPVGFWGARVRHRDSGRWVGCAAEVLVGEPVAGAAATRASWITALQ